MRKDKRLRRMAWIVLVLSCFCIILGYIRKEPEKAAVPATTPTPYDMPEETQSEMPPTKLEQLMQSMMPTSVPMPAAWEEIVGAGRTALSRRLKDMDVIVLEKGDGYGDARIVLNERPVQGSLK